MTDKSFFDNASLGALIGAASAYFLVVLNDRRRERRAAKTLLPNLLSRLRLLVQSRLEGAREGARSLGQPIELRDHGLRFPADRIERYADQGAAHLSERQTMALENLVFWMQESDRLNRVCMEMLDRIDLANSDLTLGEANVRLQVPGIRRRLAERYTEEIALLKGIDELIDAYLAGTLNERGGIPKRAENGA